MLNMTSPADGGRGSRARFDATNVVTGYQLEYEKVLEVQRMLRERVREQVRKKVHGWNRHEQDQEKKSDELKMNATASKIELKIRD